MDRLAPMPDFRYVGLQPTRSVWTLVRRVLSAFGFPFSVTSRLAIVPWGVIVEGDVGLRAMRWSAIRRVDVSIRYGTEGGRSTSQRSVVYIETDRERFSAKASGAVALERLLVHLDAYAHEQSRSLSLDWDGKVAADEIGPQCEPLLDAVKAFVARAQSGRERSLYRADARVADGTLAHAIRAKLCDRRAETLDARPFAAALAAELSARELVPDLLALVQSPHPVLAAIAKHAAAKLGAAPARTGTLDEVAPFLSEEDYTVLHRW